MAIDSIPYPEANNLAHPDKGFYPVRIPVSHWQLRHYISTPEPNLLYYASGHDVYCLNTATKKRKLVRQLPFEARCTASGFGYVCVGGEQNGHFAAIKLDGARTRSSVGDIDSALPIQQTWQRQPSLNNPDDGAFRSVADVKIERIGEEIVNSISVHRIQDEEAHLDDIVAVLTNNDNTVRLYSLPAATETKCLHLPYPMNHATISPDGKSMVAVGDVNLAYFYQRDIHHPPPQIPKPHNRLTSAHIDWTLTNVVDLHLSEAAATQCYFTTAWSPSGQLVAVGSEGGYITVFDLEKLQDPEEEDHAAVVAVIGSSRPDFSNPHPGAIRSMMFSPEPWDLLIWAEDQGRICIGDLRTGLKTRQVISLEPKDEKLRRLMVEDVAFDASSSRVETASTRSPSRAPPRDLDELEEDFIRRYRQATGPTATENFAHEYIEARQRQRQRERERAHLAASSERTDYNRHDSSVSTSQLRQQALDDDPRGLTAQEQRILETLRTTRQREEARMGMGAVPRSVNYTSAEMFRDATRSTSATVGTSMNDAASTITATSSSSMRTGPTSGNSGAALDSTFPELARTNALTPQLRPTSSRGPAADRIPPVPVPRWSAREQDDSPRVVVDGVRLPRRRASVILSPEGRIEGIQRDNNGYTIAPSASAAAVAAAEEEEENPWRTIEEHMSLSRGPLFEASTTTGGGYIGAGGMPSTAAIAAARQRILQQNAREQIDELQRTGDTDYENAAERARIRAITQARQRERWRRLPTNNAAAEVDGSNSSAVAAGTSTITAPTAAQVERLQGAINANSDILLRRAQLRGAGAQLGMHGYVMPSGREIGVRTAGLAMSSDGRTLWAACEEGVFEIEIKVKGRMFWGAVDPR